MNFASLARRAAKLAVDNSPTILTTFGVVGTVSTAYLAGRASFVAADIIRIKEADDEERGVVQGSPRELVEKRVKLVWKLYIPAATMGVATVACVIGANRIGSRRAAGLAAAYTISEKTFQQYKEKVVEKIGENKEEKIRDEIIKERVEESYNPGQEIYGLSKGELCYDTFGDRFFLHTVEGIRAAVNQFNFDMLQAGYGALAEFYTALDIPAPPYSESIGWNTDRMMNVRIGATMAPEGKPCLTMTFEKDPLPDYGRFR